MNGYTPSTPLKTRLTNLLEQVPQELRNQAAADCMQDNPYDFERVLTSYVVLRNWETNPADTAQQIEREIDADLPYPVIISGGEVLEVQPYRPAVDDDNIPF
jgi:hypothetical protein